MKTSSGLLLYRAIPTGVFVVVVHPSGVYNKNAAWSVPKGEPEPGETNEQTARREVREETGVDVTGALLSLGHVDYTKSRKRVFAFAAPLADDVVLRCASWEIDRCELLPIDQARQVIHHDQVAFVDRLWSALRVASP